MADDDYNYKKAYLREKAARDELESLLESKTRELFCANQELKEKLTILKNQQTNLMQTDKMATLGTLSAGVAHEINNPLAYVMSNVESIKFYKPTLITLMQVTKQFIGKSISTSELEALLIKLDEESNINFILDDLDELLDDTHEGLERIAAIVDNLLNFARPRNNMFTASDITLSLNGAIKLLANQLKTCDVECYKDEIPLSYCNLSAINQVFVNLLLNAKYACDLVEGQQGKIIIKLFSDQENIYVEVMDNGCGMDAQTVNQIFEPFYTTKPVGKGTGMGMAIVYNVLKEHNGMIEVQSKLNEGTLMRCIIPITTMPEPSLNNQL
ncbi:sensor histidine kinase [Pseudoalteromonas sp. BSi20652]|uniref:sensor histidine kinase n=1 Tax=Pseudoalteromonas sp. BSi20652 TaxID=388384 RepID=UPI0002319C41|nr:ATP-binding protein [Pseudoalteromonas sp. BSi20652]GAA61928.1 sensor histidine kinase [Pseudoalteromonas sp. BSi20652]